MSTHLTHTPSREFRSILGSGAWRPSAAAALFFLAVLAALVFRSLQRCGWHFGYPMDDTYIHMAMAKNFSLHGVWGATRYGFSSSTSSPLYTLILSLCYKITGIREVTPLILNILAALALLFWCDVLLRREGIQPLLRFYLLVLLALAVPLPILVFGGMEHVLHALLTVLFVHLCSHSLASAEGQQRQLASLLLLAAVLVMTRYEALFLIAAASFLFAARRRWYAASGLLIAAAIPVCIYGAISLHYGWFPLPTSLLLKANLPSAPSSGMYPGFVLSLFRNLTRGSHVLMLIVIAGVCLYRVYRKHSTMQAYSVIGLILFIATALMHLTVARTGWFFRYEAYLVVLGIMVVAIALADAGVPRLRSSFGAAVLLLCALLTARTVYAFSVAPQAATDIFDQQYQMGLFARQYLNHETVVLNDIGAVSFLSDARVLDWIGLGSVEPARARLQRNYNTTWLSKWALQNHASVAILYPNLAPPDWNPLATWTIPGNFMSGSDTVNFYALNADQQAALPLALKSFQPSLPARVVAKAIP